MNLDQKTKKLEENSVPTPFNVDWYIKGNNPNYFHMQPKSTPAVDCEQVYFGDDGGNFWAVSQKDGSVVWKYPIFWLSRAKKIFSSPTLHNGLVYFGAYNGNLYALNKETGKKKWIFMEADWIESSPCVAPDINLIFVGLEFGLWKKEGGIAALNLESGKKIWEHMMPGLTNSSPAYSKKYRFVICGCDDFSVYAFGAQKGELLWKFSADGEIKESFSFDEKRGLVCFGSFDSYFYILKTRTGEIVHRIKTGEAIYSTPLVHGDFAYIASLDKSLYCVNLDTGAIVWKFTTNGRIFASPEIISDKVYIGSNDGCLYELDAVTGKNTAIFQATERIVNKIVYNNDAGKIFLPTFANEIYCLSKKKPAELKHNVHIGVDKKIDKTEAL